MYPKKENEHTKKEAGKAQTRGAVFVAVGAVPLVDPVLLRLDRLHLRGGRDLFTAEKTADNSEKERVGMHLPRDSKVVLELL